MAAGCPVPRLEPGRQVGQNVPGEGEAVEEGQVGGGGRGLGEGLT
jgi:hypothetical protein